MLTVALAAVVRAGLLGSLGTPSPYVTFYPAVILAALLGGLPGGLLATVLSALTANFFWVEPVGQFSIRDPADWLSAVVFVMGCTMISFVTHAMQRALARATKAEAQVQLAAERSRAEEELGRYKLLAEHSRDVILYLRRDDGHILEANAAATAYGYTRDELLSLSIHDLRGADAHMFTESQMADADISGILFETVHRRKDGSAFPVEVSSQGATIGGTRTLISVIRDITERKRAEDERRRLADTLANRVGELQAILDAAPVAIWMAHDPQCRNITGNSFADQVVMQTNRGGNVSASATPGDAAVTYRVFRDGVELRPEELPNQVAATTGQPVKEEEFDLVFPGGRTVHLLLCATPLLDAHGRVRGSVAAGVDITKRRRAEEALRGNQAKLTERTAELEQTAAELKRRNLEVERANRMKTDFLSRISHELRTPLNAIVGYSELLGEQLAGPLQPPYPRFVASIQEGADHLLAMVNDLLDISRIEAGRIDLNREAFRPSDCLEEVLAVIEPLAQIKHIAIDNQVSASMSVRADRLRLKQVLFNLLSNAVKFTPENGRVWIADASRGDAAGFCVGDTGIGIPEPELVSIFDEFYQVGGSSTKEGSGLGLSITRRLVELHGGAIRVESTIGQGSRFIFSLGAGSLA
jgi:PAS domain S-box-containing protein